MGIVFALAFENAERKSELSRYLVARFESWIVHHPDFDSLQSDLDKSLRIWGEQRPNYIG